MAEEKKDKEMPEERSNKEVKESAVTEAEALPKAIVRRVVKEKLSQLSPNPEISVLRDSLQAFSESARIFIHYLSASANDICKESNRQIINAEDVLKALEEIEFAEFVEPLRASLEEFRQKKAGKKAASSKATETNKNVEAKESPTPRESRKKRRIAERDGDKNSD